MVTSSAAESEPIRAASSATSPSGSIWVPLLVALAALLGSLWLSIGMGLKACPLCFYQRTFVMGVVAVLGMGIVVGRAHRGVLTVAALPLAVAGLGVAAFHEYLEQAGKLECPGGVMGIGTAPQQSLSVLAVLLVVLAGVVWREGSSGKFSGPAPVVAVVLGVVLAGASIVSAPPMPATPVKAYETPLDVCRPPFHPQ